MSWRNVPLRRVIVGAPPRCEHYVMGGENGPCEIAIINDGKGPAGYYDRVHLRFNDGRHLMVPAHHCLEMEMVT